MNSDHGEPSLACYSIEFEAGIPDEVSGLLEAVRVEGGSGLYYYGGYPVARVADELYTCDRHLVQELLSLGSDLRLTKMIVVR